MEATGSIIGIIIGILSVLLMLVAISFPIATVIIVIVLVVKKKKSQQKIPVDDIQNTSNKTTEELP